MQALTILKKHNLRHTDTRQNILDSFLKNPSALSHGDLENNLVSGYDRVTVYRTLKTFVDNGILHKIPDDQGGIKYALCNDSACHGHEHHHDHVHFKCSDCGSTTCLDAVQIPKITLPEGYVRNEINMLVQGICANCEKE